MFPQNALFYKNIIRNAKLRKLTSVDFFKKNKKKTSKPWSPEKILYLGGEINHFQVLPGHLEAWE